VAGVTRENVTSEDVRLQIRATFEQRGLIVFEGVEPSSEMQLALSSIIGPLQDHAFRGVPLVDGKRVPGLVNFDGRAADPDIIEVGGQPRNNWVPWHFDACYSNRLNRAGLLRPLVIPEAGGETGFADGIQLYQDIDPELRQRFASLEILYHPYNMFMNMRFGRTPEFRVLRFKQGKREMIEGMKHEPRSVHPAIWRRQSGEYVLHVSPWQADGILGHEGRDGDVLLEALCQEMLARMRPYFHTWRPTDMVLWDNWRMLHACKGNDPKFSRHMHRTTIEGDYGLGRFEDGAADREPLMMVD
jgi:taurine dioxygenase